MNKMTKTKRNLVLLFMCIVMVAIAICPVSAKNQSGIINAKSADNGKYSYMKISDDYQQVATSGKLALSADFNSGLIALKNNSNGYVWYGVPTSTEKDTFTMGAEKRFSNSQLVVGYLTNENEASGGKLTYMDSYSANSVDVSEIENGVKVVYSFEIDLTAQAADDAAESGDAEQSEETATTESSEHKVISADIPVTFALKDEKFVANVDVAAIKHSDDIKIVDISLLPYFGAGNWTDDGYIFVPDGSGALIDFNTDKGAETKYSQMVYGKDLSRYEDIEKDKTQDISMPVFGVVHGSDNALFGVITDGAEASSIEAASANETRGYNTVSARLNARFVSELDMSAISYNQIVYRVSEKAEDIKAFGVEYSVLDGDDANYVGMANSYRDYLLNSKKLEKHDVKAELNIDVIGAIDVKANFLGFTYNERTSLTTYSQTQQMLEDIKAKGIDNLSVRYLGWGNSGITNTKMLTSASTLGVLGGKKQYQELNRYTAENNIGFYPESDLLTFTEGSNKNAVKTVFAKTYYQRQYLRSVYAYDLNGVSKRLILPSIIENNAEKYIKSYKKLDTTGISLSTLTNTLYSHLKFGETMYRSKTYTAVNNALKTAYDNKLIIIGDSANDYSYKYISKIVNAPTYSSGFNNFSSEIPFYEIVLHGYMPMSGTAMAQSVDTQINYLKCVESGIGLNWTGIAEEAAQLRDTNYDEYYGSTYTLWIDDAAKKYAEYQPLLEKICNSTIVAHSELAKNVTLTAYDNGYKVYVNYTDADVTCQGIKIPAKSFAYKEG